MKTRSGRTECRMFLWAVLSSAVGVATMLFSGFATAVKLQAGTDLCLATDGVTSAEARPCGSVEELQFSGYGEIRTSRNYCLDQPLNAAPGQH